MAIVLNLAEREIFDGCESGEWVEFPTSERPTVRALALRQILLGLEVQIDKDSRFCRILSPGMRVKGAKVEGELVLQDCRALPVLALENCEFTGNILLYDSSLAHLSLKKSLIKGVKMKGAEVDSAFDFSGVQPVDAHQAAWINAHGCNIRGGVRGDGAHLRAKQARSATIPLGKEHYALRLSDSNIDGSVRLRLAAKQLPGIDDGTTNGVRVFNAEGGVNISATHIRGDLICEGAKITAGERYALTLQASKIEGVVLLENLAAIGVVWMAGVRIGGLLALNGANLNNSVPDASGDCDALVLNSAEINGDLQMSKRFHAKGRVTLNSIKIHGSLACDGAHFSNLLENGNGYALVARHAEVDGSVFLCKMKGTSNHFLAEGAVSLVGAKILGSIDCRGACFLNHSINNSKLALTLSNATVGHNLYFGDMRSVGMMSLRGCQIGRNLDCNNTVFVSWSRDLTQANEQSALDATGLNVGGDLYLDQTSVLGNLSFEHSRITGSLRWDGLRFPKAIDIGWKDQATTQYAQWFDYCGVLETANKLRELPEGLSITLRLTHARIGSMLQAYRLSAEVPLLIDLSAVQVHTLDDSKTDNVDDSQARWPAGWGGDWDSGPKLDLDGFNYQRIKHFPKRAKPVNEDALFKVWRLLWRRGADIVSPRLDWLAQQRSQRHNVSHNNSHFLPQPYRQLAGVMRRQGHLAAARDVLIAAEDQEGDLGWIQTVFKKYFFGWGFGYGLSTRNATVTVLVCFLVGYAMVKVAYHIGDMVLTPELIVAYNDELAYDSTPAEPNPILQVEKRTSPPPLAKATKAINSDQLFDQAFPALPPEEWLCDNREIQPIFYAVDMMLPVIPLNQEDRCELAVPPRPLSWLMLGHIFWALFSVVGKIVTSLALITYSGVLKQGDE